MEKRSSRYAEGDKILIPKALPQCLEYVEQDGNKILPSKEADHVVLGSVEIQVGLFLNSSSYVPSQNITLYLHFFSFRQDRTPLSLG